MNEFTTKTTRHFTGCASLAAIGVKLRQLDVFDPIRKTVRIAQKTVKHTPIDKVYDAFISLLAGAQGLVEINTRLRSDRALRAQPSDAVVVPSNRWCKKPGCLHQQMSSKWNKHWTPSIANTVKAFSMIMPDSIRSWMWI